MKATTYIGSLITWYLKRGFKKKNLKNPSEKRCKRGAKSDYLMIASLQNTE